ncbi:TonB-dependent receptor [Pseudomonas stutzeri]|jgi:outer membrane receptor for ferrienterochelin and colicins|uniref:TonB-dependent receptor domain-containing protein n=1 Tax=Stutzerimonas stutzeri TaxID=316 RepID=UPI000C47104D|nr:TonB-dependent receptor [Stutzerimonas stutzeri]MBS67622.1 TonB-dependent receptor [Pseudomonas sp.]MCQ4289824.1 TonB-dependent receptor [Stutzerimonas stutzeri]|tara:strand:- start:4152 stop:6380 length:2229 start_codon:yes stop_codon:yes gene_type:complete
MPIPFARTTLSCALIGCSLTAYAQTEPVTLNDTVVSASGFEQKITEAPASISVISQEDLQQKRYNNLAQALEDVEGIDVRQGTGKTGGLNISIRGLPSEYTLILIDGRRQNTAGNVTPNGFNETATSFMPPMSAIERIEVIRGPMSTLYGSDAMGGVVNIITKKVAPEWGGSLSVDHTYQDNRDYGDASKASLYASGPLIDGLLGLAVRGSIYDRSESDLSFDNDSTVSKRGAAPVEGRNTNFGARLSLTPHENHDFSLDFERGRQVYNNDDCQLGTLDGKAGGNAIGGCTVDAPTTVSGYKDELRFERDQFALSHTGRLGFGTLDSSLTHNTTETLGRTIPGTLGTPYSGYPSIVGGNDRKLKSTDLVFDTKLVAPVGDSHIATIGAQYWDAEVEDGITTEKFQQSSWALFVEDEWRLRDDLALTLGGRYEDHEAFGGHFSPRAYLVWSAADSWTVKGGVSRGYKVPTLNQLHDGINGVSGQGTVITIGSPDLDPEITTNTEVGVYYDNLANFSANATLFHTKFKDKIDSGTPLPNCNYPTNPNQPGCVDLGSSFQQENFAQSVNIGEAETQGLELAGRWQFAPAWSLSGNYTYTDSEQKSGADKGAPLTNTPKHMAHASLNWNATDRLSLWFKGEYRGERARFSQRYATLTPANQALMDQVGELKAYEVFHLGGSFRASENVTLNATIYNLFDKDFLDGETYTTNTGATGWASHYVQTAQSTTGTLEEGRRLWLSANITF